MAHHATLLAVYVLLQHFGSAGSDSLQSRYTGAATEAVHHEMTEQVRQLSFRGGLRLRGGSKAKTHSPSLSSSVSITGAQTDR